MRKQAAPRNTRLPRKHTFKSQRKNVMACTSLRFIALAVLLFATTPLNAQNKLAVGDEAPDFPPGLFSDGRHYSLSDFHGKVVVLFFYESQSPHCKKTIPERNGLVKSFKDKPVKFFAIGAHESAADATSYLKETKLEMTVFVDNLGLMERRYGETLTPQTGWEFFVIGPDGKIIGREGDKASIEKALSAEKVEAKFKDKGYTDNLEHAADFFEWGQYPAGMKYLNAGRKSKAKAVQAAAEELAEAVRKDVEPLLEQAAKIEAEEPLKAYDLYARVASASAGDPQGKAATEKMTALREKLKSELTARKAFSEMEMLVCNATPAQKADVAKLFTEFAKKYAKTRAAERATVLAEELGK